MAQQDHEEAENLRKLLEQHWLHCRHLESERAWFMSVYAAITGGILAFMAQRGFEPPWPLYFLIVLTFFGFFHTIRWIHAFEYHRKWVNVFAKAIWSKSGATDRVKVDSKEKEPTMEIPEMRLWIFKGLFRTRYWFPLFYFSFLISFVIFFPISSQVVRNWSFNNRRRPRDWLHFFA